ncbi:MAG: endo-1,4-beta-xylanase [Verrucomicrobiota bacterium]
MSSKSTNHNPIVLALLTLLFAYSLLPAQEGQDWTNFRNIEDKVSDEMVLRGADARIERYRKGSVTLNLYNEDRKPLPAGTKISINMKQHAFHFGSNATWLFNYDKGMINRFETLPELAKRFETHFLDIFNYLTITCFWSRYEPEPGKPKYEITEQTLAWAKKHKLATKVHPLAWNWVPEPKWIQEMSSTEIIEAQLKRVRDFMGHFKGRIETYEVLNEPSGWFRERAEGKKLIAATRGVGFENFYKQLYQEAKRADPLAKLAVNDFQAVQEYKTTGIDPLLGAGPNGVDLVDIIGIQSHYHWRPRQPLKEIWDMAEMFKDYGKPIYFTELSISEGFKNGAREWVSNPQTEAKHIKDITSVYTTLFSHPNVEGIIYWWPSDLYTLNGDPCGLLDKQNNPKPAYLALKKLIKEKWWTRESATLKENGKIEIRGFYGKYEVTVEMPNGAIQSTEFNLDKNVSQVDVVL